MHGDAVERTMLLDKRTAIHAYDFTSGEGLSQYLCGTGIVSRLG